MKKKILILLVIILVVINVSAFVTLAYNRFSHKKCEMIADHTNSKIYLCRELDLNSEQIEQVKSIRSAFAQQVQHLTLPLQEKRSELVNLLASQRPDSSKIEAVADAIDSLQAELHREVIRHLLMEKEVLSQEQQKKFFALIGERLNYAPGTHNAQGLNLMDNCDEECDTTFTCPIDKK